MTDEAFIFKTDAAEKKVLAQSARHRVGKSKRVTMPSDFLTNKEKAAMNGAVFSYSLNKPYTWEYFKAFPDHIQKEYLEGLAKKLPYSDTLAGKMFGVERSTMLQLRNRLHLSTLGPGMGHRYSRETYRKWAEFCGWSDEYFPKKKEPATEEPIPEPVTEEHTQILLQHVICTGLLSDIFQYLSQVVGNIHVKITLEMEDTH